MKKSEFRADNVEAVMAAIKVMNPMLYNEIYEHATKTLGKTKEQALKDFLESIRESRI